MFNEPYILAGFCVDGRFWEDTGFCVDKGWFWLNEGYIE